MWFFTPPVIITLIVIYIGATVMAFVQKKAS